MNTNFMSRYPACYYLDHLLTVIVLTLYRYDDWSYKYELQNDTRTNISRIPRIELES